MREKEGRQMDVRRIQRRRETEKGEILLARLTDRRADTGFGKLEHGITSLKLPPGSF